MKNFLDYIIHFDEFETAFTLLYQKTREEFYMLVIDLKQIEKFYTIRSVCDFYKRNFLWIFKR